MDSLTFAVEIFNYVISIAGIGFSVIAIFALLTFGKKVSDTLFKFLEISLKVFAFLIFIRLSIMHQLIFAALKIGFVYLVQLISFFGLISTVSFFLLNIMFTFVFNGVRCFVIYAFDRLKIWRSRLKDSPKVVSQDFFKMSTVLIM